MVYTDKPVKYKVCKVFAYAYQCIPFHGTIDGPEFLTIVGLATTDGPSGPDLIEGECYFIAKATLLE